MRWHRLVLAAALAAVPLAGAVAADDPGVVKLVMLLGDDATISGGPVREFICDDGGLVKLEFTDSAVVMKGLKVGTTLCSYRDVASVRHVVRVIVKDPAAGGATPSGAR